MNSLTLTSISGNRWMKLTAMFLAFSLSFSQIPLSFAAEPIGPNNEINAPTTQANTTQSDPGPQAPPEPTAQFMEGNALSSNHEIAPEPIPLPIVPVGQINLITDPATGKELSISIDKHSIATVRWGDQEYKGFFDSRTNSVILVTNDDSVWTLQFGAKDDGNLYLQSFQTRNWRVDGGYSEGTYTFNQQGQLTRKDWYAENNDREETCSEDGVCSISIWRGFPSRSGGTIDYIHLNGKTLVSHERTWSEGDPVMSEHGWDIKNYKTTDSTSSFYPYYGNRSEYEAWYSYNNDGGLLAKNWHSQNALGSVHFEEKYDHINGRDLVIERRVWNYAYPIIKYPVYDVYDLKPINRIFTPRPENLEIIKESISSIRPISIYRFGNSYSVTFFQYDEHGNFIGEVGVTEHYNLDGTRTTSGYYRVPDFEAGTRETASAENIDIWKIRSAQDWVIIEQLAQRKTVFVGISKENPWNYTHHVQYTRNADGSMTAKLVADLNGNVFIVRGEPDILSGESDDIKLAGNQHVLGYYVTYREYEHTDENGQWVNEGYRLMFYDIEQAWQVVAAVDFPAQDTVILNGIEYKIAMDQEGLLHLEETMPPAVTNFLTDLKNSLGDGFTVTAERQKDGTYLVSVVDAKIDSRLLRLGLAGMGFIISSNGNLDTSQMKVTYYGGDSHIAVDGQLLFEAMRVCPQGQACTNVYLTDIDVLKEMSALSVTKVENGAIYFSKDGNNYKAYRDAQNNVQLIGLVTPFKIEASLSPETESNNLTITVDENGDAKIIETGSLRSGKFDPASKTIVIKPYNTVTETFFFNQDSSGYKLASIQVDSTSEDSVSQKILIFSSDGQLISYDITSDAPSYNSKGHSGYTYTRVSCDNGCINNGQSLITSGISSSEVIYTAPGKTPVTGSSKMFFGRDKFGIKTSFTLARDIFSEDQKIRSYASYIQYGQNPVSETSVYTGYLSEFIGEKLSGNFDSDRALIDGESQIQMIRIFDHKDTSQSHFMVELVKDATGQFMAKMTHDDFLGITKIVRGEADVLSGETDDILFQEGWRIVNDYSVYYGEAHRYDDHGDYVYLGYGLVFIPGLDPNATPVIVDYPNENTVTLLDGKTYDIHIDENGVLSLSEINFPPAVAAYLDELKKQLGDGFRFEIIDRTDGTWGLYGFDSKTYDSEPLSGLKHFKFVIDPNHHEIQFLTVVFYSQNGEMMLNGEEAKVLDGAMASLFSNPYEKDSANYIARNLNNMKALQILSAENGVVKFRIEKYNTDYKAYRDEQGNVKLEEDNNDIKTQILNMVQTRLNKYFGEGVVRFVATGELTWSKYEPNVGWIFGSLTDESGNVLGTDLEIDITMDPVAGELSFIYDHLAGLLIPQYDLTALDNLLALWPNAAVNLSLAMVLTGSTGVEIVYRHLYRFKGVQKGRITLYYVSGNDPTFSKEKTVQSITFQVGPVPAKRKEGVIYLEVGQTHDMIFYRGGSGVEVPVHYYGWVVSRHAQEPVVLTKIAASQSSYLLQNAGAPRTSGFAPSKTLKYFENFDPIAVISFFSGGHRKKNNFGYRKLSKSVQKKGQAIPLLS